MKILIRGCNDLACRWHVWEEGRPQCGRPLYDSTGRFDMVHPFDYDSEEGKIHCAAKEE